MLCGLIRSFAAGPLLMSPDVERDLNARVLSRENNFTITLLSSPDTGAMLPTPEQRVLNLTKEKLKLRPVNSLKTIFKEFFNEHTRVCLNPTVPTQFAVVVSPSIAFIASAATPQERDVLALLVRQSVRAASTTRNFKTALTLKAGQTVKLTQPWTAAPQVLAGQRPTARVMPLPLRQSVSTMTPIAGASPRVSQPAAAGTAGSA